MCLFYIGLISDEELQSNFLILAYAHAPLHAIFWAIYCLSLHPDEEKKVLGEISSVLAKGPLTYEQLDEFKYLNRVIAEALRLYPSKYPIQLENGDRHVSHNFLRAYKYPIKK